LHAARRLLDTDGRRVGFSQDLARVSRRQRWGQRQAPAGFNR